MGRGKTLTEYEKGQIFAYHQAGKSNRQIAPLVGRSLNVVNNFLRDTRGYGTTKAPGRPSKVSERDKRRIYREASNSVKNCSTIKKDLGLIVSSETIRRTIEKNPNIVRRRLKKAPAIKKENKQKRVDFGRQNTRRDWSKVSHFGGLWTGSHVFFQVVWSDEKKFNLDGPDGVKYYWHDLRKEPLYFSRRGHGGGSVMVWASFTSTGRVKLAFVPKKMNSIQYQFVLRRSLLPFFRRNRNRGFIFMQDNAPIHVSRTRRVRGVLRKGTINWLQEHNIPLLGWPANSPDLNPIENLWGILVRRIYAENKQYKSVAELKNAIVAAWHSVEQELFDNLILSMDNRIFQVINRNGGPIDY